MPIIKLNNSNSNELFQSLKQLGIKYETRKKPGSKFTELVDVFPRSTLQKQEILFALNNYGSKLYHNTSLQVDMNVENIFNYDSNEFENTTSDASELELPLFYLENQNEQNEQYKDHKALQTNRVSKPFLKNIAYRQGALSSRTPQQLNRMSNILFGNNFGTSRSSSDVDEYPYYNRIEIGSQGTNELLGSLLKKVKFQEEMFGGLISDNDTVNVEFLINNQSTTVIAVQDLLDIIENNPLILDVTDKMVLGSQKKTSSFVTNNFKKYLLKNYFASKKSGLLKTFKQIYENEECSREFIIYKVEKYLDTDTSPIQSFWMFEKDVKEFIDYQIKRDKTYRYEMKAFSIIYGTSTSVDNVTEKRGNQISFEFTRSESYKMAMVDFETVSVKVTPKIPLPPYVKFINESNSKNHVKIYLDLQRGSMRDEFVQITDEDTSLISNVEIGADNKIDFEYSTQDGKFEVFRLDSMPNNYRSFDGAKILDARNKHSSTSVVFKDIVIPNKKYYYMFRAVNFIGVPSNPTVVYEVELIKDASKSMVKAKAVPFDEVDSYHDKTFKNLIQITPSFQQEVFNDQDDFVQQLPTFRKKINSLTLGTAPDKVWGKKFKIRIKSKDTGKSVDLNVKFRLTKDNI